MGSSDVLDAGVVPAGRSFSRTCSLLSRYLKEKGSFGKLGLGFMTQNFESKTAAVASGSANLLPVIEKSAEKYSTPALHAVGREEAVSTRKKSAVETGEMTIFYAGQVIVLSGITCEKANEIMMSASKACSLSAQACRTVAFPAQNPAKSTDIHIPEAPAGSDLPIARKNSLARFLEKRKDRIMETAPYKAATKPAGTANAEAWLGLGPKSQQ